MKIAKQRRLTLLIMSIVIGVSAPLLAQDEPGPFERLFRAMRHAVNQPQHRPKTHRSNNHKQTQESGNPEPGDAQSSSRTAKGANGGVTRPPSEKNTKSTSRAVRKK